MTKLLRLIRSTVLTGLIWGAVWAPVGAMTGLIVDPDESMDEMWVAIGAYPGFLCGAVFSAIARVSERRCGFDELSLPRVGAMGAVSGVIVSAVPVVGVMSENTDGSRGWLLAVLVLTCISLLSAVSAAGSLALAKRWWRRKGSAPVLP